jgi:hypothetical protein
MLLLTESMPATQAKAESTAPHWPRLLLRLAVLVAVAFTLTWLLQQTGRAGRDGAPAGFARGVLHGALMPCALPQLLLGKDVTIYAEPNTGRTYKLGYTVGVNGCGAVFFGFFYWRFNRWRKARTATPVQRPS